jgi:hypothetical protein
VIDGPDHCIHCDEDPRVFIQIVSPLCENGKIYYDDKEYRKNPVACNSSRPRCAYQYALSVLWEDINYRKVHYKYVEDGVQALFPALDGKIMGFKSS